MAEISVIGGSKYRASIVSSAFNGQSLLPNGVLIDSGVVFIAPPAVNSFVPWQIYLRNDVQAHYRNRMYSFQQGIVVTPNSTNFLLMF